MAKLIKLPHDLLERAAHQVFAGNGSPEEEARLLAGQLVRASLAGHDSHGILRVHHYMNQLREGLIRPGARPEVIRDNGATALVGGNRGYGQVAADFAMGEAIARGRRHGVAAVGITDLMHIGRLADYAVKGAGAGLVSLVFTAAGGAAPLVVPFGGIAPRMATNPIAAGFPSRREYPVVFDMATSAVAFGKLRVAKDAGTPMPEGVILDQAGHPATDPAEVFERGGVLLPMGGAQGHKGYLLAFLVEALGGLLTGGGFVGREPDPPFNNCTFLITIDVAAFLPPERFHDELDRLIGHLKATPSHPGGEVLYPGEVEERTERERRRHGIPLPPQTVSNLQGELERCSIDIDLEQAAL